VRLFFLANAPDFCATFAEDCAAIFPSNRLDTTAKVRQRVRELTAKISLTVLRSENPQHPRGSHSNLNQF